MGVLLRRPPPARAPTNPTLAPARAVSFAASVIVQTSDATRTRRWTRSVRDPELEGRADPDRVQERAVVARDHEPSRPRAKRVRHRALTHEIEAERRLVEDEELDPRPPKETDDRSARSLARA